MTIRQQLRPAAAAAPPAAAATATAQDVARHHIRSNTGSTALALYRHDWKFSVPLKHFLCPPHSQLFRTSRSHWLDVLCDDLVRTPSTAAAAAAAKATTTEWLSGSGESTAVSWIRITLLSPPITSLYTSNKYQLSHSQINRRRDGIVLQT